MADLGGVKRREQIISGLLVSLFFLGYFLYWIFQFYPCLLNDEYASLEYIYRSVNLGHLYPTPYRYFKPYSFLTGFFAFAGGPLALTLMVAIFSSAMLFIFYLLMRESLSFPFALLGAVMLGFAPDLLDITVQAASISPALFFILLAIYFGGKIPYQPKAWIYYSIFAFLGGLIRPESWLLAFPLVFWLAPKERNSIKFSRIAPLVIGPGIIAFSALIWFGKDWIINQNLFHSLEIAKYNRIIGGGAGSGPLKALSWFFIFPALQLSKPFICFCLIGLVIFILKKRRALFYEPLFVFTIAFFVFLYLSILQGLYPQIRFFFLWNLLLIFYGVWLLEQILFYLRNQTRAWLGIILVIIISGGEFFWISYRLKSAELKILANESKIQKSVIQLTEFFAPKIKAKPLKFMISDRRDEQFSWILRELPAQEFISFRKAFYYQTFEGKDFLSFEPDWVIWHPTDYNVNLVQDMFHWLGFQDRTEIRGYLISLETRIGDFRVFKVTRLNP